MARHGNGWKIETVGKNIYVSNNGVRGRFRHSGASHGSQIPG
jgi:hypothetical protein